VLQSKKWTVVAAGAAPTAHTRSRVCAAIRAPISQLGNCRHEAGDQRAIECDRSVVGRAGVRAVCRYQRRSSSLCRTRHQSALVAEAGGTVGACLRTWMKGTVLWWHCSADPATCDESHLGARLHQRHGTSQRRRRLAPSLQTSRR